MAKETASHALTKGFRLQSKDRIYEIVKVLGSGSFGITYLATATVPIGNISTTIRFAIKEHFMSASSYRGVDGAMVLTVPTAKSEVMDSRADFITEANRLKKLCLKSRNIVSVNETFEANGTAYYVMEFLDGGSPSKCSEEEAISIVLQIADALKEIHMEHVLHLDLKPDNIVLKTDDKNDTYPVLIDFGISKHFDSEGRPTSSLSAKGASSGYAPQEQYAGVSEFSPKYDIYALGAVLFYLSTGKNPPDAFKISPNQQELKKELTGRVSPNIEKTILNAMKPSAMERTSSIKQFCDDLMGIDFAPVLNVPTSTIDFSKEKNQRTISIDSNITWSAYTDCDWCRVFKDNNSIVLSVSKNKETGIRTCDVFISGTSHQISQTIHVKQEGTGTVVFSQDSTWWERSSKRVYGILGVILIGGLIAGISIFFESNPKSESQRLTEAIESRDINSLRKYADLDSIRTFKPLIRSLKKQSDLELSKNYANQYAKLDSIDYLIPMAEIYYKEKDYYNSKLYVDKYLKIKPDDESIKLFQKDLENLIQKESQREGVIEASEGHETNFESDDERFARASKDFNLMLSLAKNNYVNAYYPLAVMYYDKKDNVNAKLWAQKSIRANVNKNKANVLLERINSAQGANQAQASDEEMLDKAVHNNNISELKRLANKGVKGAYVPLAKYYYNLNTPAADKEADIWAKKAQGVGLSEGTQIINNLEKRGLYD